jgi:hypothetical protein
MDHELTQYIFTKGLQIPVQKGSGMANWHEPAENHHCLFLYLSIFQTPHYIF